ncbi:uncharacterized protein LOC135701895 [Ochlerotatus camptorhynchus]|uniref:uncharacterized protein LOC135701895 n=1 Tax=Ochlerotatus camptorhynchus TaxID=644619 RepID=UPI0031D9589D
MALNAVYCLTVVLLFSSTQATVTIIIDDDLRECGTGAPLPKVDISHMQIITEDDGSLTVNGTIYYNEDYGSPTRWRMNTKRLERGQWVPGIMSREVLDLCPALLQPSEIWYPVTSKLRKADCPFKKGYEEHMDMINIGNPGELFNIPPNFVGEWQVYHEIITTRRGLPAKECFMTPVSITEV